jgi:hypothetical protein
MDETPGPGRSRAMWFRRTVVLENGQSWTALAMPGVLNLMKGVGTTPAAALDNLADRLRHLADEIDDGGELRLAPFEHEVVPR